jgi:ribosomal protein S18 acetylase RimI-like enzyme
MDIYLRVAEQGDLEQVLTYVRAYHEIEGITHSALNAASAVRPLLGQSTLGRVWLICRGSQSIGHIAICFGYSIEFGGRDAIVDELFILPEHRGKGFGKAVLALVKSEAALLDVKALHLEVARSNEKAQRLYKSSGFISREGFFIMSVPLEGTFAQQRHQRGQ